MRSFLLAAVAILLLAPLSVAQDGMTFTEEHQVRVAFGDIPSTDVIETANQWNFEHTILADTSEELTILKTRGHFAEDVSCDCDFAITQDEEMIRVAFLDNSTPEAKVTYTHSAAGYLIFGTAIFGLQEGDLVLVYLPEGASIQTPVDNELPPGFFYPGAEFQSGTGIVIHQYHADGPGFWFTVQPVSTGAAPESGGDLGWLFLFLGLALGAGAWYALVRFGYVQKRQRKQVAGEAVHKTVAKTESKAVLEGRKRVLMAGLKELEVAKMNKELATEDYDVLKADFKRQTVTVMRALEESA